MRQGRRLVFQLGFFFTTTEPALIFRRRLASQTFGALFTNAPPKGVAGAAKVNPLSSGRPRPAEPKSTKGGAPFTMHPRGCDVRDQRDSDDAHWRHTESLRIPYPARSRDFSRQAGSRRMYEGELPTIRDTQAVTQPGARGSCCSANASLRVGDRSWSRSKVQFCLRFASANLKQNKLLPRNVGVHGRAVVQLFPC
jgi:hypothetical protein